MILWTGVDPGELMDTCSGGLSCLVFGVTDFQVRGSAQVGGHVHLHGVSPASQGDCGVEALEGGVGRLLRPRNTLRK